MKRKYAAIITCRNGSSRLYGKPLQNLDVKNRISVIEHMICWMRTVPCYGEIVLAIAEGIENQVYEEIAKKMDVSCFWGAEEDVLARAIFCAREVGATDITRFTPESPYTCFEVIDEAWNDHIDGGYHASFLDNVPNGANLEILSVEALAKSHKLGNHWHRTMGCSLYIREHKDEFNIRYIPIDKEIQRPDIRLTIDYPEDLILCRAVYEAFKDEAPRIPVRKVIRFLDTRPDLMELVRPFVGEGLETMYL